MYASNRSTLVFSGLACLGIIALAAWFIVGGHASPDLEEAQQLHREASVPAGVDPGRRDPPASKISTVPISDPSRVSKEEARSEEVAILVVNADGNPVEGASVVMFTGKRVLAKGLTDRSGAVRLPAPSAESRVIVAKGSLSPHIADVPHGVRSHTIALRRGSIVGGQILLNGSQPEEPLCLVLQSVGLTAALKNLSPEVFNALGRTRENLTGVTRTTEPGGRFRFEGLPSDWSGSLHFPVGFVIVGEQDRPSLFRGASKTLPRAESNLSIDLRRVPLLTGRVVTGKDHLPVPFASLIVDLRDEQGGSHMAVNESADKQGRFKIGLYGGPYVKAVLLVMTARGAGLRRLEIEERLDRDHDLGDIELEALHAIPFVVRNEKGEPVEGAVASTLFGGGRSDPTDTSGKGHIKVIDPNIRAILVVAQGYWPTAVTVPKKIDKPLIVTLQKGNALDLKVSVQNGPLPKSLEFIIVSKEPLFLRNTPGREHVLSDDEREREWREIREWCPDRLNFKGGSGVFQVEHRSGRGFFHFTADGEGCARLECIRPHQRLSVLLADSLGLIIWRTELVMGAIETRTMPVDLGQAFVNWQVRVRNQMDEGVARATVYVQGENEKAGPQGFVTNEDGVYQVQGVYSQSISVSVRHPDYAPLIGDSIRLSRGDQTTTFTLRPGRTLVIDVIDEEERRIAPERVWCEIAGIEEPWEGLRRPDEKYELRGLPRGSIVVWTEVAGKRIQKSVGPTEDSVTLVVRTR